MTTNGLDEESYERRNPVKGSKESKSIVDLSSEGGKS